MQDWFRITGRLHPTFKHEITGRFESDPVKTWGHGRIARVTRILPIDHSGHFFHGGHHHITVNPIEFYDFLRKLWGEGHLEILRDKANSIMKTNKILRKEISDHYRAEFRAADADPDYVIVSYN